MKPLRSQKLLLLELQTFNLLRNFAIKSQTGSNGGSSSFLTEKY